MILSFFAPGDAPGEVASTRPAPEYGSEKRQLPDLLTLRGKRALTTGVNKGVGRGLVSAFAVQEASIVAVFGDEIGLAEVARATVEAEEDLGGSAAFRWGVWRSL